MVRRIPHPCTVRRALERPPRGRPRGAFKVAGVIQAILDVINEQATERRPITKREILAALVKMFPDRVPSQMANTINSAVPHYLNKVRGQNVVMHPKFGGYYNKVR